MLFPLIFLPTFPLSSFTILLSAYLLPSIHFHTAKKELNERNILSVLHEAEFADVHWEILGQQLIESSALMTIRANRPNDPHLCMIDIISRWLSTDPQASWEKLATAVGNVKTYGETTAAIVQQKATIVGTADF